METNKINELLDKIGKFNSISQISLNDNPQIQQNLFGEQSDDETSTKWDELCRKLDSCKCEITNKCCCRCTLILVGIILLVLSSIGILTICNRTTLLSIDVLTDFRWIHYIFMFVCVIAVLSTIVILFYKYIQFHAKQCEANAKVKEKLLNAVIDAFNEDREFSRLRTKTEIALREKSEKARIDEWCRNKENERKLNIMEQERTADLNKTLLELAKVKDTFTFKYPDECGKTISIERSIFSKDCCDELKDMMKDFIAKYDCCCGLIKKILKCLFYKDGKIDCEAMKKVLKCLICDTCSEKNKEMLELIKEIFSALGQAYSSNNCNVNVSNQ